MVGLVNNIQKYSIHDGGGIRTVVFMQGCPLHCLWCSNPETQSFTNRRIYWKNKCIGCGKCVEVCPKRIGCTDLASTECTNCFRCVEYCYAGALKPVAREMTVEELVEILSRDVMFYQMSGGGVTLSGGEVLMQWEFAAQVLSQMCEMCVDTAIETTGFAPYAHLEAVARYCDRLLYDVKHMDDLMHKKYVGVSNERILKNLSRIAAQVETVIRIPLIHGVNDGQANIQATADFAERSGITKIDLLPFHRLGESKYTAMQRPIEMPDATVPEEHVEEIRMYLAARGFTVSVGG